MSWNTSQLAEKKTKFCTPGTQSVRKWRFLGVPADGEKRVRRTTAVNEHWNTYSDSHETPV